jgi:hypothetical protein
MKIALKFVAAALALALAGTTAVAQLKAPDTKKETTTAVKKKAVKKAPSPCAGLEEAVCKANTMCSWYKEVTTKKGHKRKAHCQKKSTPPAKKAAKEKK